MAKKSQKQAARASARAQIQYQRQLEAKRQRRNKILGVLGVVVAIAVAVTLIALVVQQVNASRNQANSDAIKGDQIIPSTVGPDGVTLKIDQDSWNEDAPLVTVFEDPQCPACAQINQLVGPYLEALTKSGDIRAEMHILHGLDYGQAEGNSYRAAVGFACAADQDKYEDYANIVFASQNSDGWTDDQLRDQFSTSAGITGDNLTRFQTCYNERQTADFVTKMQDTRPDDVTVTPSFLVNGKLIELTNDDIASQDALLAAFKKAV